MEVVAYLRRKAQHALAADFDARAQRRADLRFRKTVQTEIKCID